jgi:hypothetical protein
VEAHRLFPVRYEHRLYIKNLSYSRNRPWKPIGVLPGYEHYLHMRIQSGPHKRRQRPVGLWNFEYPTLSRKSAHGWRWSINIFWHSFRLQLELNPGPYGGWKDQVNWEIRHDLIGTRTRDLPACSLVPQSTALQLLFLISDSLSIHWCLVTR